MTPQTGILAQHPQFARHISLTMNSEYDIERLRMAMAQVPRLTKAFATQFPEAGITSTVAVSLNAWQTLYSIDAPDIRPFPKIELKKVVVDPSPVDFFIHIRTEQYDVAMELGLAIYQWFKMDTQLFEEKVGFRYFGGRDLTGFVGHTGFDCPVTEREQIGVINNPGSIFHQGSFVHIQRFLFDMPKWQTLPTSVQEEVMGRDKRKGYEIEPDQEDLPHIHRVRHAHRAKLIRAGMPYGNLTEQGHFFVSYASNNEAFECILSAMLNKDDFGQSDPLLRYAKPVNGASLFAPSIDFLIEKAAVA